MTISVVDRIRLESMLGMLGSNHVGERDNAAKLIAQFLQRRGLTWPDVLGRYAVDDDAEGKPKARPNQAFWKPEPRTAYTGAPRPGTHAQDVVWRWSMLIGLVIVGSISLMSLIQQRAADPTINANVMAEDRCGGVSPACPPFADTQNGIKSKPGVETVAAAAHRPSTSFAQGLADRKVAQSWHKLAPPGLCAGRIGSDREEFRSACLTAEKLLTEFDRRRRTDPEYRRGWNSLSS
jgi:hypothetical protein